MLTIYHLANSRSERMIWLALELGLGYELVRFERDPATRRAPEEMKEIHPLGKSPVIRDGDMTLIESGAIVEYLATKYGAGTLAPQPEDDDYARYLQWLHYAEGSAMFQLILDMFMSGELGGDAHEMSPRIREGWLQTLDHLDGELATRPWFAGDRFTAADVMMGYPLVIAKGRGQLEGREFVKAYVKRIVERPAYIEAQRIACG